MAEQLYFSRDTRMFLQFRNPADNTEAAAKLGEGRLWEIPILDGFSFSQTTNTSEITLNEMESSVGVSRRGRRMFTDSLAPAEWSFSTYIRPFISAGGGNTDKSKSDQSAEVHAVEEALWAAMFGADTFSDTAYTWTRATNAVSGAVITPAAQISTITIQESNRSALTGFTLYFLIDTNTTNPLLYRLPEAVVNEATVDFDVDGIATINWSGFAKEIQDKTDRVLVTSTVTSNTAPAVANAHGTGVPLDEGDILIETGDSRSVHIVSDASGTNAVSVQAIDEAVTSTKNFIRNRLTSVKIEAADQADKVAGTFPGNSATISAIDVTNEVITTSAAHGFKTGDRVNISGCTGNTHLNGTHHFVRVGDETSTYAGTTNATTEFALFDTEANAKDLGNASGLVGIGTGTYDANTGTASNGKYSLTLTGGSFTVGNNITYLVPEELGAINKPLEHVTGTRQATGNATCYLTLEDSDIGAQGTSRQFFNDLVSTSAMSKVVNKFKVTMDIGGSAAADNTTDPCLTVSFPTAHIEVPTHSIEDVISLETNFVALPTDFGAADEITSLVYRPVDSYA